MTAIMYALDPSNRHQLTRQEDSLPEPDEDQQHASAEPADAHDSPSDTSHPTGDVQAAENSENESPG